MSHRDLSARVTYYLIRIYRIDPDDSKNNNNSSSRESELGIPLNDPGCNHRYRDRAVRVPALGTSNRIEQFLSWRSNQ